MDWANDRLGRLVHAADRHVLGFGFRCPTCGEPVRLRVGVQRRAHFAHYSHSPKPDCEEYHPSVYPAPIFRPVAPLQQRPRPFQRLSMQGGVYLGRDGSGRFSLHLRLPRLKTDSPVEGQVRVQSGLGVRTLSAEQLLRPQFMQVSPQVPLVEVVGSQDMEEVAAAIEQDIALFRASGNFFAGTESARLLQAEESLEWGETYRLLTQRPLAPAPAEIGCELLASASTKGWFIYQLELPLLQEAETVYIGGVVSDFLGRAVSMPSARAYIIDPMPHHVALDGAYVYPSAPIRLLLRRTGAVSLGVSGSARSEATRLVDLGEWIEVRGLGNGEAFVVANDQIVASVRIEECPPFDPQGVDISIGSRSWRLFDVRLRDELAKPSETVVIQSSTNRIADAIALDRTQWRQRSTQHILIDGIERPRVDAANFGRVTWEAPLSQPDTVKPESQPITVDFAARLWIEGLVGRVAGPPGVAQVQRFWAHGEYDRVPILATHPWLRPYISAALSQRKTSR